MISAHLHLHPVATNPGAIQLPAGVLCITLLLHLNESKSWRPLSDPYFGDAPDLADGVLDVVLVGVVWEAADVDLSNWVHHP